MDIGRVILLGWFFLLLTGHPGASRISVIGPFTTRVQCEYTASQFKVAPAWQGKTSSCWQASGVKI